MVRAHELWSATLLHVLKPDETIDLGRGWSVSSWSTGSRTGRRRHRRGPPRPRHAGEDRTGDDQPYDLRAADRHRAAVVPGAEMGSARHAPARACWTQWFARASTSPTAASTPTSTQRPRPSGRAVATTARSSRSRSLRSPPTPEATSPDWSRSPSERPPFPVRTTILSSTSPSIRSQPWRQRWVAISNVRSTSYVWPTCETRAAGARDGRRPPADPLPAHRRTCRRGR